MSITSYKCVTAKIFVSRLAKENIIGNKNLKAFEEKQALHNILKETYELYTYAHDRIFLNYTLIQFQYYLYYLIMFPMYCLYSLHTFLTIMSYNLFSVELYGYYELSK